MQQLAGNLNDDWVYKSRSVFTRTSKRPGSIMIAIFSIRSSCRERFAQLVLYLYFDGIVLGIRRYIAGKRWRSAARRWCGHSGHTAFSTKLFEDILLFFQEALNIDLCRVGSASFWLDIALLFVFFSPNKKN